MSKLIDYIKGLKETFTENPCGVLSTGILFWFIFPILIMGVYAICEVTFKPIDPNLDTLTELFTNALIPWWVGIVVNPIKSLLEILAFILLALVLIDGNAMKPITFKELIKALSSKK